MVVQNEDLLDLVNPQRQMGRKRREFTTEEVEEIKRRYAINEGLLTIAKALGTSQGPITRILKDEVLKREQ